MLPSISLRLPRPNTYSADSPFESPSSYSPPGSGSFPGSSMTRVWKSRLCSRMTPRPCQVSFKRWGSMMSSLMLFWTKQTMRAAPRRAYLPSGAWTREPRSLRSRQHQHRMHLSCHLLRMPQGAPSAQYKACLSSPTRPAAWAGSCALRPAGTGTWRPSLCHKDLR